MRSQAPLEVMAGAAGCGHRPSCGSSGFSARGSGGQEGLRECSRKGAAVLAAMTMAGRRPRAGCNLAGAELLAGPGSSCCWSWSESWKEGLAVPELCVGWRGSGGGEAVVLGGENT